MSDVLAIVGSTQFVDVQGLDLARVAIEGVLERRRPDLVISGAAEGVDTLGVRLARERGIAVREFPPANKRWAPEGYKQRNDRVADACTRLVRVACRFSRTYGSGYTHDRAAAQGKLCWSLSLPTSVARGEVEVRYGQVLLRLGVDDARVADGPAAARTLGWIGRDVDELLAQLVRRRIEVRWRG